jgi:hypothetical protein
MLVKGHKVYNTPYANVYTLAKEYEGYSKPYPRARAVAGHIAVHCSSIVRKELICEPSSLSSSKSASLRS